MIAVFIRRLFSLDESLSKNSISHKYLNQLKMVNFELGNLFKMPQILKIPELVRHSLLLLKVQMIFNQLPGNGFHHHDGG